MKFPPLLFQSFRHRAAKHFAAVLAVSISGALLFSGFRVGAAARVGGGEAQKTTEAGISASATNSLTLKDGSVLTFYKATFGTDHRILLEGRSHGRETKTPSLVCWFERSKVLGDGFFNRDLKTRVQASLDFEYESSGRYDRTYPIGPEKELVVRAFEVFPRRATNITVRVREADDAGPDRHVGEFTIRNPVRGPFKEWSPEPLPVTRRDGEIEFTLTKLVVASHDGSRAVQHMQAFFRVTEGGKPSPGWSVAGIGLADATGNILHGNAFHSFSKAGEEVIAFVPALGLDEPAWRVSAGFRGGRPRPEEMWKIRGVAIPAPDGATMVRTSTFIHGHRIELVGLHGKQGRLPGFPASLGDYGNMHVQVTPPNPDIRIERRVFEDNEGRPIAGGSRRHGEEWRTFEVSFPTNAQTLNLTFSVQRWRHAEFVVKPPEAPSVR